MFQVWDHIKPGFFFFMPKRKGAAALVDTVDKYRMVDKTA
jgi:hypothetical protein